MNLNSKINWQPGLELTAQTFRTHDEQTDYLRQATAAALMSDGRMGLLPGTTFSAGGVFVRNTYQIDRLQLTAYLPSGRLIDIDEPVTVRIPMLYGKCYYLTASVGTDYVEYEREGVPLRRPTYSYEILSLDELEQTDKMPFLRFDVEENQFTLSPSYIAPCLTLGTDPRLTEAVSQIATQVEKLGTHANLEEGEGRRLMMRYLFLLRSHNARTTLHDLLLFLQEIAQAVDYYIVRPHVAPTEIPVPSVYDVQLWLSWLADYLDGAESILDRVVLEDHSIDFDALKAQIKAELYEQLNPELYRRLIDELKEQLTTDITQHVKDLLSDYLNQVAMPTLYRSLSSDLQKQLYDSLYQPLYDALYNALYVPEETEDEHIPTI